MHWVDRGPEPPPARTHKGATDASLGCDFTGTVWVLAQPTVLGDRSITN